MGEVYGFPPTAASATPTDHGPDLEWVTTSHTDGRAGWWQSPRPALARGRGGEPPGLLYNGLFHQLCVPTPVPCPLATYPLVPPSCSLAPSPRTRPQRLSCQP